MNTFIATISTNELLQISVLLSINYNKLINEDFESILNSKLRHEKMK